MVSFSSSICFRRVALAFVLLLWTGHAVFAGALPVPFLAEAGKPIDQWSVIGPFSLASDESATSALAQNSDPSSSVSVSGIPELEASVVAPSADHLLWHEDQPFCWFGAAGDFDGWLNIGQCFGSLREGNVVYLHRSISVSRNTQIVISLGSNGPLMAWLDGQPLPELAQGIWSPPGDSRWLEVLTLKKGTHQLLIRSGKPEAALSWAIRARFLNTESFAGGNVIYPRWQISAAPPWTGREPSLWARWGDPAIQDFIGMGPTTGTVEVTRYADPAGAAKYKMAIGQTVGLSPFAHREGATLISLRAEMPDLRQGMLEDRLSLVKSPSFLSVVFGSPEDIPSDSAKRMPRKATDEEMSDAKAVSQGLRSSELVQDDPQATRLGILRRTQEFLTAEKLPDAASPIPSGWLYLACGADKKSANETTYALQLPAGLKSSDTVQLVIVLVPLETDAFHVALREPGFASVAEGQKWILTALNVARPLRGMKTDEQMLESVRKDLERRFKFNFSRVCLIGFEDAAPLALVQALLHSDLYTGAATLDGRWNEMGMWDNLFLNHCPRPAIYLAGPTLSALYPIDSLTSKPAPEDGAWMRRAMTADNRYQTALEMFTFLQDNMTNRQPEHVTVSSVSRLQEQPRWLSVRQSLDLAQPSNLVGSLESTNTLVILPRNVSQFDVLLKEVPNLVQAKPLLLKIGDQDLRVIGRQLPEALRVRLVEEAERPAHWEAAGIKAEAVEQRMQDEQTVAEAEFDVAPLPNAESSSIARLYAAAARKAAGAQVAVVPANAVESGQANGKITRSDVEGWSRDSQISTTTLSKSSLIATLSRDYAGPRLYVTDGIDGIVHSPTMDLATGSDEVTTSGALAAPTPIPAAAIVDPAKILRSTALEDAGATIVVAGWKSVLEQLAGQQPLNAIGKKGGGKIAPTAPLHDAALTQMEAVIRMLTEEKKVPQFGPDIRGMERKKAEEMKKPLN